MTDNEKAIKARGHWLVTISPKEFVPARVPYADLEQILTSSAVHLRGWPVPFIDYGAIRHGSDWIGGDPVGRGSPHREAWRFWTSGQFAHLNAVGSDWRDSAVVPSGANSVVAVWEILFYVSEVFELATRLAVGPAGADQMTVSLTLNGMDNRELVVAEPRRAEFFQPMRAATPSHSETRSLERNRLVARPRELAAEVARDFFLRFGWAAPLEQLMDHQEEVLRTPGS